MRTTHRLLLAAFASVLLCGCPSPADLYDNVTGEDTQQVAGACVRRLERVTHMDDAAAEEMAETRGYASRTELSQSIYAECQRSNDRVVEARNSGTQMYMGGGALAAVAVLLLFVLANVAARRRRREELGL